MSTTQDKQDLTVTVTTPEQDAPLSSAAPQTVAAGEDCLLYTSPSPRDCS